MASQKDPQKDFCLFSSLNFKSNFSELVCFLEGRWSALKALTLSKAENPKGKTIELPHHSSDLSLTFL